MKKRHRKTEKDHSETIALTAILIFHLAGFILLSFSNDFIHRLALDFVPINLILTSLILIKFQKEYSSAFWLFLIFAMITGFIVELIGVNTGKVFGSYRYGDVLGPGVLGTPFLIGLNWFMVAYSVIAVSEYLPVHTILKFFTGVLLLVCLDYLMEPVAMRLGFWEWENGNIPEQNYVGWAVLSGIILGFAFLKPFKRKNKVAAVSFFIQLIFFSLLNIF
jgi:putative membrane protein